MPFDQTTIGGFVGMLVNGLTTGLTYLVITTTIASLFLSMGLYLQAFCSHYESMFGDMNEIVAGSPSKFDDAIPLNACLVEAIKFHNQAKE